MKQFKLKRHSNLPQEKIFAISTDVENFHNILPNHFKSLRVVSSSSTEKNVIEKIKFLGFNLTIKTKHLIKYPTIHEVHILSGPTKGTVFIESYIQSKKGTDVVIEVKLQLNGIFRLFSFLENYIVKQMDSVMNEFINSSEKLHSVSN